MSSKAVRNIAPWMESVAFLTGIACVAWVLITWALAAVYQYQAKAQLEQALASATEARDAGRSDEGAATSPVDALVGELEVPRLGLSAAVLEGDDEGTLRVAVGHLPDTALPWEKGNSAVAGHRDSFFRPLQHIRIGDSMRLRTRHGEFEYRVRRLAVVEPENVGVLNPSEFVGLTLITCYPFGYVGSAPKRYIVQAERVVNAELDPASRLVPSVQRVTSRLP